MLLMLLTRGASVYLGSWIGHVHSSACDSTLCMPASRVSLVKDTDKSAYSRPSFWFTFKRRAHLRAQLLFFSKSPVKKVNYFFCWKKYNTKVWAASRKRCSHISIDPLIFWALSWTSMRIIHFPLELLRQAESTALPTMKTALWHLGKAGFLRGFVCRNRKTLGSFFHHKCWSKVIIDPRQLRQNRLYSAHWNLKAGRHVHLLYVLMNSWRGENTI